MEKRDARTLSQEAQEEVRRQAIKGLEFGKSQAAVARELDVSRATVNSWWKRHREGGWKALRKRRRGRQEGTDRKLTVEQEKEVQRVLVDKTPDQLKLRYALWSREAVGDLIKERFGVHYSLQNLSVMLKRWGFTPQRPLKKASEQRPAEVKQWLEQSYPAVEERARAENAEIGRGDETAIKPECHFRRGFSLRGKTPVVRQPAKRFHNSLTSAINNQGKMQWMPLTEALNSEHFIKFLRQLIKYRKRKIILIVDNLRVHHSKPVKEWLSRYKKRIELVFLPAYSPELNPDEYLNNYLKQTVTKEGPPREKDTLDEDVWFHMTCLGDLGDRICSFFLHPKVRHAS